MAMPPGEINFIFLQGMIREVDGSNVQKEVRTPGFLNSSKHLQEI
jgi:hypothetical protein